MTKKRLVSLLILIFIVAIFTACAEDGSTIEDGNGGSGSTSGGNEVSSSNGENELSTDEDDEKDPIELVVYSAGGAYVDEFERDYGNYIEEMFPHITVKLITPRED